MLKEFSHKRFIEEKVFYPEIEKILLKKKKTNNHEITIGIFLEQKTRYEFNTIVLEDILNAISNYRIEIFYRGFKNSRVLRKNIAENIGVQKISFDQSSEKAGYEMFKISSAWVDCDFRIIITRPSIHTHHSEKYSFGLKTNKSMLAQISEFNSEQISIDDYEKIILEDCDEINKYIDELGGKEDLIIADLQQIKKTDEHSFFSRSINHGTILLASSINEAEKHLLELRW